MKRRILAFLCAISVLTAGIPFGTEAKKKDTLELNYQFGNLKFENEKLGTSLELDGLDKFNSQGMPDLPSKSVVFVVPKGKQVDQVKVTGSSTVRYEDVLIAPSVGYHTITQEEAWQEDWEIQPETESERQDTDADTQEIEQPEVDQQETLEPEGKEQIQQAGQSLSQNDTTQEEGGKNSDEDGIESEELADGKKEDFLEQESLDADSNLKKARELARSLRNTIDFSKSSAYNTAVYEGRQSYPQKNYSISQVQEVRGFRICTLTIYPMSYSDGSLSYNASMNVKVTFKEDTQKNQESLYVPDKEDLIFLDDDLVNKEQLSGYLSTSTQKTGKTIAGEGRIDYIIITNNKLKSSFQKLAKHKKAKGLKTAVVTTEKIYKNYSGRDKAEKIRNFIKEAYQKNRVKYVLLGGDGDGNVNSSKAIVPTRLLYCPPVSSGITTQIASDMYYACLSGNYDSNKNAIYGEPNDGTGGKEVDLGYDVFIGRAPVDNKTEANNFVTKTINYEKRTKQKKALMVGEQLTGNYECSVELASELQGEMDGQQLADTIRSLRDGKIKQEYISMYYQVNETLQEVLMSDLTLAGQFAGFLVQYYPQVKAYLEGKKETEQITRMKLLQLYSFCQDLETALLNGAYDEEQKQIILKEISYVKEYLNECEGKTFQEAFEGSHYYNSGGTTASLDVKTLDVIYGGNYKDEIKKGSSSNNITTKGIPKSYKVTTLYDRDSSNNKWKKTTLIKKLNASPELINHMGHSDTSTVMRLTRSDASKLKNTKAFFFYSQGCYAGSFDNMTTSDSYESKDSIAEYLLVSSKKSGAFACVVNSRYGWFSSTGTNGPSQIYDRWFWHYALNGNSTEKKMGVALAKSKQKTIKYVSDADNGNVIRFCMYTINLLGDPETAIGVTVKKK
ncbi:MAG: hypothetical protein HDR22_00575 [Lachnospiraceae bacterium]|nr:hypothetical protein [Lachnospiraceae bacterium]